jgi:hypothetical protein
MRRILFFAGVLVLGASATIPAQWLNYKTPGVPRSPDGKPKLDAPAPRTADGRPDLSGVWMHEVTTVAEYKRLFGPMIDDEIKVDVPGMEIGTQHKYGINILIDFKPEDSPVRPATADAFKKRLANPPPEDLCDRGGLPVGIPLAGLLSEPIKIVQAPALTMVLYELGGDYRQIYTAGRIQPAGVPRLLGWAMGARHVHRRDRRIQRPDCARCDGTRAQRSASRRRTLPSPRLRPHGRGDDVR